MVVTPKKVEIIYFTPILLFDIVGVVVVGTFVLYHLSLSPALFLWSEANRLRRGDCHSTTNSIPLYIAAISCCALKFPHKKRFFFCFVFFFPFYFYILWRRKLSSNPWYTSRTIAMDPLQVGPFYTENLIKTKSNNFDFNNHQIRRVHSLNRKWQNICGN